MERLKLDRFVNKVLQKFWPEDEQGNRKVWFHSINESSTDREPDAFPLHARWFLHANNRTVTSGEYCLRTDFWRLGFGLSTDTEDNGLHWNLYIPFLSLHFKHAIPGGVRERMDTPFWDKWNVKYGGHKGSHKYTALEIFDLSYSWLDRHHRLSWNLLKFDWGWSREMPKWMDGSFDPTKFLFGDSKYENKTLSTHNVMIPMPEGCYPAVVEMHYSTWKRPRLPWFSHKGTYGKVDVDIGIPHEGKGENSWDCGEDATYGISCDARTVEDAIGKMVAAVLNSRRKYNGSRDAKYPDPETRRKAVMKRREEAEAERKKNPPQEAAAT